MIIINNITKMAGKALLSGGVALAAFGLASGIAHADDGPIDHHHPNPGYVGQDHLAVDPNPAQSVPQLPPLNPPPPRW